MFRPLCVCVCVCVRACVRVCVFIAGHYVPATGQVIVESNSVYAKNLKGIGIGNGWVDPYLQYAAYPEVYRVILKLLGPLQFFLLFQ